MKKIKFLEYTFPVITIITMLLTVLALGIIHWNKSSLFLEQKIKQNILKKKQELMSITEELNTLKENATLYRQKKIEALKAIQENEKSLASLIKAKAVADGVIASADSAAQNEKKSIQNLNKISEQVKHHKDLLEKLEKDIGKRQTELSSVSARLSDAKIIRDSLESQKAELLVLKKEAEFLKQNIKKLSTQYASIQETEKNTLEAESKSRKQLNALGKEISQANLQLAGLNEKQKLLSELNLQIADRKKSLQAIQEELDAMQQKKRDMIESQTEFSRLNFENKSLKEQNQRLLLEQKSLEEKNKGYSKNLLKLQQELTQHDLQITNIKKLIAEKQKTLNNLSRQESLLLQTEQSIIQKQTELQKIQNTCNLKINEIASLKKQVDTLQKKLVDLQINEEICLKRKAEVIQSEILIKQLNQELEDKNLFQNKVTAEISDLLTQKNNLSKEVTQLEEDSKRLKTIRAALIIVQEELFNAKQKLRQTQEQISIQSNLEEQYYKDFSAKKIHLEVQIKQLETRLSDLSKKQMKGTK